MIMNFYYLLYIGSFFLYIYRAIYLKIIHFFLWKVLNLIDINSLPLLVQKSYIKQFDSFLTFESQI